MTQLGESTIALSHDSSPTVGRPGSARPLRLVVVDDDWLFRESLSQHLTDEGFAVTPFSNGARALEYLAAGDNADVILLDWRMPGMNGLDVLRGIRRRGMMTPVVFLTAFNEDTYEEAALAGGAVDFVDKSRRLSILVRRVEMIADGARPPAERDAPQSLPDLVRLGPLELRFDINRALWQGHTIDLTLTEFRLVSRLALKPDSDVSYRELYDLVHGKDFVAGTGYDGYRANVRTFIKRIRKKFRGVDPAFDQIRNYARFGYRWAASQ